MATLFYRGELGHLGGEASDPSSVHFVPGDFVNGRPVGYASIADDDYRDAKLALIQEHAAAFNIVAVDGVPARAPTVRVTPAPTFRTPTVADGWNQYR